MTEEGAQVILVLCHLAFDIRETSLGAEGRKNNCIFSPLSHSIAKEMFKPTTGILFFYPPFPFLCLHSHNMKPPTIIYLFSGSLQSDIYELYKDRIGILPVPNSF